jgi:hypothetical protein
MGALELKALRKKMVVGIFLPIVLCFIAFSAKSITIDEQATLTEIGAFIQSGKLRKAEYSLREHLKSKNHTVKARYEYAKLLGKVYLNEQDFDKYLLNANRALTFAQRLHPIYVSEVYAQKAYYWHYMMWSDSALVYSNKAMDLFRKHRSSMDKIDVPFMYEVYAITYLYRNDQTKPKAYLDLPIADYKRKQFQWFDSAVYYQNRYPFKFSIERSMLYKSYANRWLDLVVGDRSSNITPLQYLAFEKANALYNKGIDCLQPWDLNDFLLVTGLKGAIHTYIGRYKEADEIFKNALMKVSKKTCFDRSKVAYQPLIVFLTFHVRNTLELPYNKRSVAEIIHVFRRLRSDFWRSFDAQSDLPYDPYRTSPYINLFNLYALKSQNEGNGSKDFSTAVSYLVTLKSYFHFLKNWPDKTFQSTPFVRVSSIQKQLKKNECFLLTLNENEMLEGKKIVITRSKVCYVKSTTTGFLNERAYDTLDFKAFQRISYQDFMKNFSDVLRIFPTMKKVYISYDDKNPYEVMLKDTLASGYSTAHYLGNSINFVRVYNPFTYFKGEKVLHSNRLDVQYLRQNDGAKLPFMNEFFNTFETMFQYSKSVYSGDIKKSLYPSGIFHLYGHGEFVMDDEAKSPAFQLRYVLSNGQKSERRLTGEFPVHRDLVVLNNCFSGYANFLVNEFNRSIPLRILSNGAKSVLVSPKKVDDYFSSEFFRVFYQKIGEGMLFEDAAFMARKEFFLENPAMRRPQYWDAFQLIQREKLRYRPVSPKVFFPWWILVFFSADLVVSAGGVLLLRRAQIHRHTSKES